MSLCATLLAHLAMQNHFRSNYPSMGQQLKKSQIANLRKLYQFHTHFFKKNNIVRWLVFRPTFPNDTATINLIAAID